MRAFLILIFCIVVGTLGVLWLGYSTCQEPPVKSSEQAAAAQTNKDNCSSPGPIFKVGLREVWLFVRDSDSEIVAFSTIIVAIFTIILGTATVVLARSTRALASGAKEAAQYQLRAYISARGSMCSRSMIQFSLK